MSSESDRLVGLQKVNVRIVTAKLPERLSKATTGDVSTKPQTKAMGDPYDDISENEGVIEPPYDTDTLSKMNESSNALTPMVDAYKTNIAGFGYDLVYNIDMESKDIDQGIKDRAKKEWVTLDNFYKYCNFDQSFSQILMRVIGDREYIGWGCMEVLTSPKGAPVGFEYVPAHTIRISKVHPDPVAVVLETIDSEGKKTNIAFARKFRKYCQKVEQTRIWFREFGDPRRMDKTTGDFETELDAEGNTVTHEIEPGNEASSLLMFTISVPYSVYGIPRWMGNLLGIQGSMSAEQLNMNYFTQGRHIPLAIVVKNGSLTQSSIDMVTDYVSNGVGIDNAFKWLVIEAAGFEDDDPNNSNKTNVDIDIKPLVDAIQNDGLFQDYDQANRDKLRAAMRLAPIYTGESKDYTRATADVAKSITEEQVFQPERAAIGGRINRLVNHALGIRYVDMKLAGPDITNKKDLADTLKTYVATGAVTPNIVIDAISELLGKDIERISEPWGNLPLTVTLELIRQGKMTPTGDSTGDNPTYTDSTTESTEGSASSSTGASEPESTVTEE